ncbi:hypothetical protein [Curtobacterium pusillum]|uniref:hypothetical protein n=1 Tax=Curtobacterium pusillum TaxID=69373 RepID=UPI0011A49386|nr:hypothetical protein [Curtobacterium pusillum]
MTVVRGSADPSALRPFGLSVTDQGGAFRLELEDPGLVRSVTTRTSFLGLSDSGVAVEPSTTDERTDPVSFRTLRAVDVSGAAWEVLGERDDECLATPHGLDAIDQVLVGSPRGGVRVRARAGLRMVGTMQSEWSGDGQTVLPAGPMTEWHGRAYGLAPGFENRTIGSMPPPFRIAPGATGLLLRSPADLAAAFATGARRLDTTVVEVPTDECGPVSEVRTTARWNGLPVELAQPYLVWRDRGRAVVLGTGTRPDSRTLETAPLEFLPPSGDRWAVAVAVTDLTDVLEERV